MRDYDGAAGHHPMMVGVMNLRCLTLMPAAK